MNRGHILLMVTGLACAFSPAGADVGNPPSVTDSYQITCGPAQNAYLGDPAFLVPLTISVSQPTERVNLIILYDPVLLTPTLLAPNMFFQRFVYDLSIQGRINISLVTDLPPPPNVPPIMGDTIFAWISFYVTTQDIGYDYLTHLTYYEDPVTPYPDNFIVLDNSDIIAQPVLTLQSGDILVVHPMYGDININDYAFEIGDAVTFLNFFMGYTQFNRRQYANSDCNRDRVQATISDLVYLLRIISGDTTLSAPIQPQPFADKEVLQTTAFNQKQFDALSRFDVEIKSDTPLGGASLTFKFDGANIAPKAVALNPAAGNMQLLYRMDGDRLIVTIINWDTANLPFNGGKMFSILYEQSTPFSGEPFNLISGDYSDNQGRKIEVQYQGEGKTEDQLLPTIPGETGLYGYPNPFNSAINIRYDLPLASSYNISIFDILGRRVATLLDGYQPAGSGNLQWHGLDDSGASAASGVYFVRLRGETTSENIKIFLMK